jgi:hypothetical protein
MTMRYSRRIVIDVSFDYPDTIDEATLEAIVLMIEDDARNEASSSVVYSVFDNGLDDPVSNINVKSFHKELDDGD